MGENEKCPKCGTSCDGCKCKACGEDNCGADHACGPENCEAKCSGCGNVISACTCA